MGLEHVDAPADMRVWPEFHNGVAAGLRIAPGISQVWESRDFRGSRFTIQARLGSFAIHK